MDFKTEPYDICRLFVKDHIRLIDSDVTGRILGWIRQRNIKSLSTCTTLFPCAYHSGDLLAFLMQVEAFFKKNALFTDGLGCDAAALLSFKRAEKLCRITNKRLDHYYIHPGRLDPDMDSYVSRAVGYIERTLGDFEIFLDELPRLIRVTAGATETRSRRKALPFLKIHKKWRCTSGASPYLKALGSYYGYEGIRTRLTEVNRVEFVPKNWKTSRTIACEPDGNMPLQLAFDTYAKKMLKKKGIDLSDQTKNQRLAKEASIGDSYATIDLSMASDTVAFNTVAWLLPQRWFKYLSDIRCRSGIHNAVEYRYAKFSSMGNGATFALETMIFSALCFAVGSKSFSVYGDDIIIEKELVPELMRVLSFFGFVINEDKSYIAGPFRESCGVNCYLGRDITPFYLREWTMQRSLLCHNLNGIIACAVPGGELWKWCEDKISEHSLPLVPFNDDSMSGIFIDVHSAYSEGLFKTRRHVQKFKAFKPKSTSRSVYDIRTLFLWNLDRFCKDRGGQSFLLDPVAKKLPLRFLRSDRGDPREPFESSRVPTLCHKYVRKWVYWNPPVAVTPDHMYMWSDTILRRMSEGCS